MVLFWNSVQGNQLAQGDLLPRCRAPIHTSDLSGAAANVLTPVLEVDLIIMTQSCDLENQKVAVVALCPIHTLTQFENESPVFRKKGEWEKVRKGRVEGLHLLASAEHPTNNREALVVDFRQILSLPFDYLARHAESLGPRWRLQSPFLEHFSQAFARFFMRVGLPSAIPAYD